MSSSPGTLTPSRPDTLVRCEWAGTDPLMVAYHDEEWGVPVHDDRVLFEFLTLEGAQAGLSWSTILKKRDGYRRAFADWDAAKVARFTPARVEKLMHDPGIVRNRLKIQSTISNARAFLDVQAEHVTEEGERRCDIGGGDPDQRLQHVARIVPARQSPGGCDKGRSRRRRAQLEARSRADRAGRDRGAGERNRARASPGRSGHAS